MTMVTSSSNMKVAAHTTSRVHHFLSIRLLLRVASPGAAPGYATIGSAEPNIPRTRPKSVVSGQIEAGTRGNQQVVVGLRAAKCAGSTFKEGWRLVPRSLPCRERLPLLVAVP